MKTLPRLLLVFFIAMLAMPSCQNKDINADAFKIERERVVPSVSSVSVTGSYSFAGTVKGMKINVGEKESLIDAVSHDMQLQGADFSVVVENLTPNTEYYYCYSVDFGAGESLLTETGSFKTKEAEAEAPTVKTLDVLAIDSTTFRVKCEVVSDGGSEVTERGICWNTYGDPTLDDETKQHASGGLGQYTLRMEELAMGKRYYVRAYAKNAANKLGYSEEVLDFVTEAPAGQPVEIELSCDPEQGGTMTGGGTYEVGTQCTVTATANTGYTFVNWTENGTQVSSEASYTFAVMTSRSLVAHFTKQAYVITAEVDPEDSGTVTGAGGYDYGEQCTLTATPKTGYDFQKWTKGSTTVSTEAEYSFAVNASATYVAHFKVKSYTVTVTAHPSNGGTVSGGGTVNFGQNCTVHAVPAEGYAFANWTDEGDEVSTNADYTFPVTGNRTLIANFTELQPDEYIIQVSASPTEGGTVSGGGTYQEGQSCKVKATANAGYNFVNWTENGNQVSDLAEYTFTIIQSRTLVAHFEAQAPTEYTVTVSANPSEGGSVTGGGTYQQGEQCTVTATPATGYIFTNWTENGTQVSANTSYTFIVNDNRNLVANFTQQLYTITTQSNPTNGGTVNGGGEYYYGQNCTLTATANTGYTFDHWTKDGSTIIGGATINFAVTANATYVAYFTAQSYTITTQSNPTNGGSVSGGGNYTYGQNCTLTATANMGYTFDHWTKNGSAISGGATISFAVTANATYVACFNTQSYTITTQSNPTNGGTVSGGGNYTYGQNCTLTATANVGFSFDHWTKNGSTISGGATINFAVTANATYVAYFNAQSYTITTQSNPTNGGTVNGGGNYTYGQNCSLTATANAGFSFDHWTKNGSTISGGATINFAVTANATYVAYFNAQSYTITTQSSPTNGGSVSGGGTYNYGQSCTLTATPATGYAFVNWTRNGTQVSTQNPYTFTVTGNRTLVANFTYNSVGGHEYVDLGLPSGLLWATCNVGADSPDDYGDYFAWGETQPKSDYNWGTYQYCMGSNNTLTKYCNDASLGHNGYTDNLTTLQTGDDAALANWGSGWRMPTYGDWLELLNNTTVTWTMQNGVNGRRFTASNGNSIFLPAAGYRDGISLNSTGAFGLYWSSSLFTSNPVAAYYLGFGSGDCNIYGYDRNLGQSVRPVRSASKN